ncbi:putative Heterochromatin-associated protein MENT [Hypsibius exemplaris]|uniref:Heterochromatin-associated protein MENT n=1 Tax=Hypsibius exemplaris TaxID=2072580 RepID=A0A1W0WFZ3_HYPEX|nr:putative Heterochromatin-associated protein MENT [Hypsibius exemplaris]
MEHLRKPLATMAMRLFQAAKDIYPDENVIICPYTVTSIVTMLYYAADGTLAGRQMEHILKYSDLMDGRADLRAVLLAFRDATRALMKNTKKTLEDECAVAHEFQMVLANRIFLQRDSNINPEFLEIVQKNLKIDFEHVNFDEAADAGLTEIERWLKEKIKSRFAETVPQDLVDHNYTGPRMVIASAAHFRAGWEVPFDRKLTKLAPFYTNNGKVHEVEMMHVTGKYPYYEDTKLGLKLVELPYFRNEASLVLTLPAKRGGLEEMTRGLTGDVYTDMHMRKRLKMVKLSLPKFRFHSTYNMKALLTQVGIKEIFNGESVLASMTTDSIFRISEGVHKSAIQIDEDGTFATEPTTVGANQNAGKPNTTPRSAPSSTDSGDKKASPSPGVEDFNANHPFLLAVRHNRSGVFLFSGRIMSP